MPGQAIVLFGLLLCGLPPAQCRPTADDQPAPLLDGVTGFAWVGEDRLLFARSGKLELWSVPTRKSIAVLDTGRFRADWVAAMDGGRFAVATSFEDGAVVIDIASGKKVAEIKPASKCGVPIGARAAHAFAMGLGDGSVVVYAGDWKSPACSFAFRKPDENGASGIGCVALSADGRYVAASVNGSHTKGDTLVAVYDVKGGARPEWTHTGGPGSVMALAFAELKDGHSLLFGDEYRSLHRLSITRPGGRTRVETAAKTPFAGGVRHVSCSADGSVIYSAVFNQQERLAKFELAVQAGNKSERFAVWQDPPTWVPALAASESGRYVGYEVIDKEGERRFYIYDREKREHLPPKK